MHLPTLLQAKASSLAQLRADRSLSQACMAQYLQDQARQLNSRVLSALLYESLTIHFSN